MPSRQPSDAAELFVNIEKSESMSHHVPSSMPYLGDRNGATARTERSPSACSDSGSEDGFRFHSDSAEETLKNDLSGPDAHVPLAIGREMGFEGSLELMKTKHGGVSLNGTHVEPDTWRPLIELEETLFVFDVGTATVAVSLPLRQIFPRSVKLSWMFEWSRTHLNNVCWEIHVRQGSDLGQFRCARLEYDFDTESIQSGEGNMFEHLIKIGNPVGVAVPDSQAADPTKGGMVTAVES